MSERTLTITGKGDLKVTPDVIILAIGFKGQRSNYSECLKLAESNNESLSKILIKNGLDPQMAKTTRFFISENEKNVFNEEGNFDHKELDGYNLEQNIKIHLENDNPAFGKLLEQIGDELSDTHISIAYALKDPDKAHNEMLEKAVKDAMSKAMVIANATGCELGDIVSIKYTWDEIHVLEGSIVYYSCSGQSSHKRGGLKLNPEDLSVSDDVIIVWNIK